ncbi:hypothetical protein CIHG_05339 [Coccidioides immitis H538.4]|uniref:LPXTG-motif cell wall anchor domain-containing protein n=1 Tax=Coccidioides immitis H538.4 TaxID=396776 RepID=A0A0J8UKZ9_COCIT|nr:hypothetical protein CIHG_05339 [Coccidioides immitis H538.4]
MRLDAASAVTTLPSPPQKKKNNNNNTAIRTCSRSRSQTDPSARHHHHHHPPGPSVRDRRSVDFASPTHRHKPASLQFNPASPLSSESFSNPALASFSPRKVAALKSGARAGVVSSSTSNTTSSSFFFSTSNTTSSSFFSSSSSIPKLLLQTPRAARDLDLQSQSSSAAHFNSPLSPGTLPSAASSTVSPSESFRPPSTIDSRTSYQKRAPASRSSLGIETASGPPPALSTQRSLAQERHTTLSSSLEYPNRSRSFGLASSSSSTRDSGSKLNSSSASTSVEVGMRPEQSPTSILKRSSLPTRTVYSSYQSDRPRSTLPSQANESPNDGDHDDGDDDDDDLTARLDTNADASSKDSDDSRQKNEDVFLNIAKSSSSRRDSSKFGLTGLSSPLRTKEDTPPPDRNIYDSQDVSPLKGYTTGILRSAASSHPLDDSSRLKYLGSTARSTIGLPRSRFGRSTARELSPEPPQQQRPSERRGSAQDTFQLRAHRQSNIPGGRGYRALSNSDGTDPAKLDVERSRYDGTESTLSTTAPSTVWDELDDLKSRIRKLELTGKLPTSSAAAMSSVSGERPRTATTTVTTISSSPKHGRRTSASPNNSGDAATTADAQMQTLLRTGLTKVKPAVSPEIYSALEATANDALTLSSMFGSNAQQLASTMSVVGTATGSDRQFKRKVDSMCRSLTELCIALADQKLIAASKNRPGSRDATSSVPQVNGADTTPNTTTTNFRRSASHEPEDVGRQAGSLGRTLTSSRLEGRRSSMLNLSTTGSTVRSSQEASDSQVTLKPSTPVSRIGRSSTTATLRNRRQDEEDTHDKSSIVSRTLSSRVFTDIPEPKPRHSLIHRSSREFSPSHDQQTHQDQQLPPQRTIQVRNTPSNQSGIPLRRTFLSTGSHLSTTSHLNIQPGYRRYGSSVINTGLTPQAERRGGGGGAAGAGAPDQGETVSSPLTATATTPTTRTASHFSSMQQLRPRTNSFGTRRLSLRRTLDGGSVANAG